MRSHPSTSADASGQPVALGVALRAITPALKEFPWHVSGALTLLVAAKLAGVALPLLLKQLVDTLAISPKAALSATLPVALLLAYGSVRFANVLLSEIRDVAFGRVSERAMRRAALKVFEHLHRLDLEFHLSRKSGALAREIERGVDGIGFLLRFSLFTILPTLLELALITIVLWSVYELSFAAIAMLSVVIYVGYSIKITDWRTRFVREANDRDGDANGQALDSLLNFETVKYFNAEAIESRKYDHSLAAYETAAGKSRGTLALLNLGQALIIAVGLMTMVSLAALRVQQGRMSIGDFVAVNAFMTQLFLPLNVLGFVYREIRRALTDMGKLFALQAITPKISSPPKALAVPSGPLDIHFAGVRFGYHHQREILQNVDFRIPAGKTVAVVGASGGGKSTLARLLFRFYDPHSGSICIAGHDIKTLDLAQLRQKIAVVPQDVVLFNDTLRANICYAAPETNDRQLAAVLEQTHLSAFVARLPEGLSTKVGERGLKLSGGEKQRVAIARALLKQPEILIFDEATSSLDNLAEATILATLRQAAAQKTVLLIAHRLSTVTHADEIVVLEDGQVKERGSHPHLLQSGGVYARLWAAQAQKITP